MRVANKIAPRLTSEGDLIVHCPVSQSQQQNKEAALKQLAYEVKEARLQKKFQRGIIKKMRSKKSYDE